MNYDHSDNYWKNHLPKECWPCASAYHWSVADWAGAEIDEIVF